MHSERIRLIHIHRKIRKDTISMKQEKKTKKKKNNIQETKYKALFGN